MSGTTSGYCLGFSRGEWSEAHPRNKPRRLERVSSSRKDENVRLPLSDARRSAPIEHQRMPGLTDEVSLILVKDHVLLENLDSSPIDGFSFCRGVPCVDEQQAVLDIHVEASHDKGLLDSQLTGVTEEEQGNLAARVRLNRLPRGQTLVTLSYLVTHRLRQIRREGTDHIPTSTSSYPEEVRQYLIGTADLPAQNPEFLEKARNLMGTTHSVSKFLENLASFMRSKKYESHEPENPIALGVLHHGGSGVESTLCYAQVVSGAQ
jgi:hypothetical protein